MLAMQFDESTDEQAGSDTPTEIGCECGSVMKLWSSGVALWRDDSELREYARIRMMYYCEECSEYKTFILRTPIVKGGIRSEV